MQSILRFVLFVYLLVMPLIALVYGNTNDGILIAVVGVAAILLTRLQDLREFSFLGVVAKMQEKIQEADRIIENLRKISTALARGSLQEIAMSGQLFSGLHTSSKFKVREDIVTALKDMDIPDETVLETQYVWITVYGTMLVSKIIATAAEQSSVPEIQKEVAQLDRNSVYDLPTPDAIDVWGDAKRCDKLTELLKEYRLLLTTGSMSNPDIIPFGTGLNNKWKEA
ncbi:MAG: hypothetical protein KGH70_02110 [Rhodospirillales bacterium]|nr:hypothetical protein [Rhodospirillales bacterium]